MCLNYNHPYLKHKYESYFTEKQPVRSGWCAGNLIIQNSPPLGLIQKDKTKLPETVETN